MQSGRVTQRCHNSPRWETGLQSANDVTHWKRAEDFGRFWKSQLAEMRPVSGEYGWLSLARGGLGLVSHGLGSWWKSQNRKIVPLSPYVEKPLCSKVIKSFVPELRSRYVFFEFRDSYVLRYICNEQSMYVSHIAVSGYGTLLLKTQQRKVYYSSRSKRVRVSKGSFWCCQLVCWSLSL